jgi:hypothetical protein
MFTATPESCRRNPRTLQECNRARQRLSPGVFFAVLLASDFGLRAWQLRRPDHVAMSRLPALRVAASSFVRAATSVRLEDVPTSEVCRDCGTCETRK